MSKLSEFLSLYAKPNTARQYRINLRKFFALIYGQGDVEEQAERYLSEQRDREADLKNFFAAIKDSPPKTIISLVSTVKSFLMNNRIELPELLWRQLSQLRNHRSKAITDDRAPIKAELREIINNTTTPIGKTLFVTLATSGMRIGEAVQIKLDDLDLGSTPAKIRIRANYTKTGTKRITFITDEAKQFVQQWLKQRESYLKTAASRSRYEKSSEDDRLFPIDYGTAKIMWFNAIKKSGLAQMDKTTNRYVLHPHTLRKFFRTNFSDKDIAEALMGHDAYLSEAYRRYSEDQLAEIYLKNESSLLIFGNPDQISKLSEQASKTDERVKHLIDENMDLRERLHKVEEATYRLVQIAPKYLQEALQKTITEESRLTPEPEQEPGSELTKEEIDKIRKIKTRTHPKDHTQTTKQNKGKEVKWLSNP